MKIASFLVLVLVLFSGLLSPTSVYAQSEIATSASSDAGKCVPDSEVVVTDSGMLILYFLESPWIASRIVQNVDFEVQGILASHSPYSVNFAAIYQYDAAGFVAYRRYGKEVYRSPRCTENAMRHGEMFLAKRAPNGEFLQRIYMKFATVGILDYMPGGAPEERSTVMVIPGLKPTYPTKQSTTGPSDIAELSFCNGYLCGEYHMSVSYDPSSFYHEKLPLLEALKYQVILVEQEIVNLAPTGGSQYLDFTYLIYIDLDGKLINIKLMPELVHIQLD